MHLGRKGSVALALAVAALLTACSSSATNSGAHVTSGSLISPTATKTPPPNLVTPHAVPLPMTANVPIRLPTWKGDAFAYAKATLVVFQAIALTEELKPLAISLAVVPKGEVFYCSDEYGGPIGDASDGFPNAAVACDPHNQLIVVVSSLLAKDTHDRTGSGALGDLLYAYVNSIPIPSNEDMYSQQGTECGVIMGVLFAHRQVASREVQAVLEDNSPYGYMAYIYGFVQGWSAASKMSDQFAQAVQLLLSTPQYL